MHMLACADKDIRRQIGIMADRIFDKNKPALMEIYNNITSKPYSSVMVDNKADTQSKLRSENFEPMHEISNNVVCATSKAYDQPAHTRSLIRAFASRLGIL